MTDAHTTLGLPPGADEAAIRRRYLELVREYPPERCPDQFARIRAAYDHLRDPETRLYQQLFQPRVGESLDEIIADVRREVQARRIPTEVLLSIAEG